MTSPQRTCIGCRQVRPVARLVRCRISAERSVVCGADAGRVAGRGAWLCVDSSPCLDAAVARKAFERAWRRKVDASAIDTIRSHFADRSPGTSTVPHRRSHNMEQWRAADPVGRAAGTKG